MTKKIQLLIIALLASVLCFSNSVLAQEGEPLLYNGSGSPDNGGGSHQVIVTQVEGKHTLAMPPSGHTMEGDICPVLPALGCIDLVADPLNNPIQTSDNVICTSFNGVWIDCATGQEKFTVDAAGEVAIDDAINLPLTPPSEWWIEVTRKTRLETAPSVDDTEAGWRSRLTFTDDNVNYQVDTASDKLLGSDQDGPIRSETITKCYRIGQPSYNPSLMTVTYVSEARASCVVGSFNTAKVLYNNLDVPPKICWN